MDESVFASWGGENAQFYCVKGVSGVTACHVCKKVQGVFVYLGFVISHSFGLIVDCAENEFFDFGNLRRFQFEDDRAGD